MAKRAVIAACWIVLAGVSLPAAGLFESQRLERAKDLIAEEQWLRAIAELQAAAEDPKERDKDEALFWLAHSQHQVRRYSAALETIERLEKAHKSSRWVRPAQSLRVEIAQRLGRADVLWFAARPPDPPAPPAPPAPPSGRTPAVPPAPPVAPAPPVPAVRVRGADGVFFWSGEPLVFEADIRVEALANLIRIDAAKAIPMLKEIALDAENPGPARRALFVLAQSPRPEARSTVVEVARSGPEPVQIAAVRELGRIDMPNLAKELMEVYTKATNAVRYQVVTALGEREATIALMRIAQQESNPQLREAAVAMLGVAGGRQQLTQLYSGAGKDLKRAILAGYLNARADEELIRVVRSEKDPVLRGEAIEKLGMLGTPRARAFLATIKDH
jgi:hypothetical protein